MYFLKYTMYFYAFRDSHGWLPLCGYVTVANTDFFAGHLGFLTPKGVCTRRNQAPIT